MLLYMLLFAIWTSLALAVSYAWGSLCELAEDEPELKPQVVRPPISSLHRLPRQRH